LIPNLQPLEGAKDNFGKDVSDKLRDLIDDMDTHVSVERNDVRDALRKFDLKEKDLGCIQWRQLAVQMSVELVFCGQYTENNSTRVVNANFQGARSGEPFTVPQFSSTDDDHAAQEIHGAFQDYVRQLRAAAICVDYVGSQQWDNALGSCEEALSINPTMVTALYSRGRAKLGKAEGMEGTNGSAAEREQLIHESLTDFEAVMEQNPVHESALQSAGYGATLLGDGERALGYFRQMLELDPGNVDVRLRVALDLMEAGDPAGALTLAEEGVEFAPEDMTLKLYIGHFALPAAQRYEESEDEADRALASPTYEKALTNYDAVFTAQPDSADAVMLRNMLNAMRKLEQGDRAVAFADRAEAALPDDAGLLVQVATVRKDAGDLDRAIATLERARSIDDSVANFDGMMASWLIEAGRLADARAALARARDAGSISGDEAANLLFAFAINGPYKDKNWSEAVGILEEALPLAEAATASARIRFFAGYSLLQWGIQVQDGETAANARRSLPLFQRAGPHLANAGAYQEQAANLPNLRSAVDQYIEIQEALIRRGR
jgi:tetratricopeptide (TPR) repeat protein